MSSIVAGIPRNDRDRAQLIHTWIQGLDPDPDPRPGPPSTGYFFGASSGGRVVLKVVELRPSTRLAMVGEWA